MIDTSGRRRSKNVRVVHYGTPGKLVTKSNPNKQVRESIAKNMGSASDIRARRSFLRGLAAARRRKYNSYKTK